MAPHRVVSSPVAAALRFASRASQFGLSSSTGSRRGGDNCTAAASEVVLVLAGGGLLAGYASCCVIARPGCLVLFRGRDHRAFVLLLCGHVAWNVVARLSAFIVVCAVLPAGGTLRDHRPRRRVSNRRRCGACLAERSR